MRGVQVVYGRGYFEDSTTLRVETDQGQQFIQYEHAIVAVGSKSAMPKAFDLGNPRVMTSREALEVEDIPENLLVVGGGYIGMELGTVYATLGSKVVVVEALDNILTGADPDLARPVMNYAKKAFKEVRLKTKVAKMATSGKQIRVEFESDGQKNEELYDRVLVAVGRTPNSQDLGLENTKASLDDKGFIRINNKQQTTDPAIYAIGDIVLGTPQLAHVGAMEGIVAVSKIAGKEDKPIDLQKIPNCTYCHPEIGSVGLTEAKAKELGHTVKIGKFPFTANSRASIVGQHEGFIKIVSDAKYGELLGVHIIGPQATELIAEAVTAMELEATVEDLMWTIHAHPALAEAMLDASNSVYGLAINA